MLSLAGLVRLARLARFSVDFWPGGAYGGGLQIRRTFFLGSRVWLFAAGVSISCFLSERSASGFGAEGHAMVGQIADDRLAGTPAGQAVSSLLDGISLAQAATIPDQIKGWDGGGPDRPGGFHLPDHPEIEKQLAAFWAANPKSGPVENQDAVDSPSHHWFHYTDVPVAEGDVYSSGTAGRSKWDIVHMTDYCIRILQGKESDDNPRKITKPVAIILLTHYLGDIHQPLHVGAAYFDKGGKMTNPDKGEEAFADQGGNTFFLLVKGAATTGRKTTLHGFWDSASVASAFDQVKQEMLKTMIGKTPNDITTQDIAKYLSQKEIPGWQIPATIPLDKSGEYLADDILPLAKTVHDRLRFENIQVKSERGEALASGFARESAQPDGLSYTDWAGKIIADKLDEGGWRLASILQQALTPPAPTEGISPNASATPAPAPEASATPAPDASASPAP